MKKLIGLLFALVLLFCIMTACKTVAYADGNIAPDESVVLPDAGNEAVETVQEETQQTEFFSWATLATYAGAVLFATLVTQFAKKISWLQKVPTQVICYIIAVIGLLAGTYFTGTLTISSAALCLVNGLVVAVAANGTYDNLNTSILTPIVGQLISSEDKTEDV